MGVILENMIGSTDKYEQNANTVSPSSHRKMYSLHILCSPMIYKPSKWPPGRPRGGRKNLRLPWLAVRICGISGDLSGGCRVDPSYPVVGNQKRLSSPALCRRAARPNIVHRIYKQYKNMINSAKWEVVFFQSRPKKIFLQVLRWMVSKKSGFQKDLLLGLGDRKPNKLFLPFKKIYYLRLL